MVTTWVRGQGTALESDVGSDRSNVISYQWCFFTDENKDNPLGLHMGLETMFVKHRACGIFLTDKSHHHHCGVSFCVKEQH